MANKTIGQLTAAGTVASTDKLEIETSTPASKYILASELLSYIMNNSTLTLQNVINNSGVITPESVITNTSGSAQLQLDTGIVYLSANSLISLISNGGDITLNADGYINLQSGTIVNYISSVSGSNLEITSNRDIHIDATGPGSIIATGTNVNLSASNSMNLQVEGILTIDAVETDINGDIVLEGFNNKLLATNSSGKIVSVCDLSTHYANDAAAAIGGVPVGGLYYNSSTNALHTRMS